MLWSVMVHMTDTTPLQVLIARVHLAVLLGVHAFNPEDSLRLGDVLPRESQIGLDTGA